LMAGVSDRLREETNSLRDERCLRPFERYAARRERRDLLLPHLKRL